jgi:hypothetical protein
MKYAIEMGSEVRTYTPSSIQTGSGIQILTGGIHKHTDNTDSVETAQAYFHFFKIRKLG